MSSEKATPRNEPGPWLGPGAMLRQARAAPVAPTHPRPSAPPAPPETAEELFQRLRDLHKDARVLIDLDTKRLMHMDSPVGVEAESNQWVYALLVLTVVLWLALGYKIGVATSALAIILYLTVGKSYVRRRIERRVREHALENVTLWRKLWNFGGVALREAVSDGARCAAPQDNWMEFVRRQNVG